MKKAKPFFSRRASALVTTLLVITLLTIIVVAFLQSMSIESKTAKSFSNILKAQFAAEAAQVEATSRLASLMKTYPYHAIGYTNIVDGGTTNLVPLLFGAPSGAAATNAAGAPKNHYLYSVTNDNIPGTGLNASNSTAINRTNTDAAGWMGSPLTNGTTLAYRECRAPWVYLLKNPNLPHQPDKSLANYNPYVSRYAWWVEDETSKVDILQAGNAEGGSGAFRPPQATNLVTATNTIFQDAPVTRPSLADLGAAPLLNGAPIPTNAALTNRALITFLTNAANLPRDGRILAQSILSTNSEVTSRFYTTLASVSDDLSGTGQQRVNLNAIVTTNITTNTISSDLDDIIYVITGTHLFAGLNNAADSGLFHDQPNTNRALLPNFGERFWPASDNRIASSFNNTQKRNIYLIKLAANIRDYIDSDNMPTFVDRNGKVVAGQDPGNGSFPPDGTFPSTVENGARNNTIQPQAIGQEAIPYVSKVGMSFGSTTTDLYFDQYFTFFNPSTKTFVAPSGTFLRGYKRMSWSAGGFGTKQMAPFELDLSGLTVPSGRAVVITTSPGPTATQREANGTGEDPVLAGSSGYGATVSGAGGVFRSPIKKCPADGTTPGSAEAQEGTRVISNVITGTTTSLTLNSRGGEYDWYTHMMWGSSNGYYGGYGGITITKVQYYKIYNANQFRDTATTMRGNDAASHYGDARSLQEPLALNDPYLSGSVNADQDQYRFYSSAPTTDLASPVNNLYLDPPATSVNNTKAWPDYWPQQFSDANPSTAAYAVVRDEPMTSIGELGNIYDPYRRNGNNAAGDNNTGYIDYARGGARSLCIGQPDDVIVNGIGRQTDINAAAAAARFTPAWANGAWHLTDIFDVVLDTSGTTQTVNLTNAMAPAQSRGKININSVLRDDGAAMRTLLRSFVYLPSSPSTDSSIINKALADSELNGANGLIPQIKTYLQTKGPFLERGELSQLAFFGTGTAGTRPMATTKDRAREEIFRRIVPMLTTRSSSFSVYSIGQAVREDKDGVVTPLAEALKGNVYNTNPMIGTGSYGSATNYAAIPLYERF